jgi:transcriptional regulator with XRE-family HTH domain
MQFSFRKMNQPITLVTRSAMDQRLAIGRQIADARRRHGLSQPELARMLDRPVSWMSQVERGIAEVDPAPVLEAVTSALGGPLPAQSASFPPVGARRPDPASALRKVLSGGPRHRRTGLDDSFPPTVAVLSAKADMAWALTGVRRYDDLADVLSDLVPELEAAVRTAGDQQQRRALYELMVTSYQACSAALAKLGEHESAKTAASRALTAAQRAGDLLLAASSAYLLVCILMEAGRYPQADETARKAAAALAQLAADRRPEAISLRGALTLRRALIAARAGDRAAAQAQLSLARDMASELGAEGSASDTGFGLDHVAVYEVTVRAELDGQPASSHAR